MQARKLLLSLTAIFIFQSAWAGSSGDSCTSHPRADGINGTGESEYWEANGRSYGCNCDKNADMYVGTGYEVYDKSYPYVGKCMSNNGGMWLKTAKPCHPGQPRTAAEGTEGKIGSEGMGTCWEIWCKDSGKYFIGTMAANGTRNSESIRFDKCESCPAAQVLSMTTSDDGVITLKIVSK